MASVSGFPKKASSSSSSSSWSQLPLDLLREIANRINSYQDFISFGSVCSSWRSVAINDNFNRSPQIPWLLLRTDNVCPVLFNNSKRKFYKPRLPEANSRYDPCFSFASHGWLLIQTSQICLLHPLTRRKIILPDKIILKNSTELVDFNIQHSFRAALSSSPTWTENFSVLITYRRGLALYESCRSNWTYVDANGDVDVRDVIFYKDQFYFFDSGGRIWILEVENNNYKTRIAFQVPYGILFAVSTFHRCHHLVEVELSESKSLMLVLRRRRHGAGFIIYRLNFDTGECEEVERLENKALFLGQNTSLCVETKNKSFRTGFMPNRIYFIDHNNHKMILSIYDMQTGRSESSHVNDTSFSPTMWIELLPS